MHILRDLRRHGPAQRLPELRRRIRAEADPSVAKLEGRQFPGQRPGKHEGEAQTGRSDGTRALRCGDPDDTSAQAIESREVADRESPLGKFCLFDPEVEAGVDWARSCEGAPIFDLRGKK
jgi:hypothetical protein